MLVNFRDIGGIKVSEGQLKQRIFYRGGQLTNLTDNDKNLLTSECEISKIYDFRSQKEISAEPDDAISGIAYENLDILASATAGNSASLESMIENAGDITKAMMTTYENLVLSESALKGYNIFLTEILKSNKPIYFHCFAGKDRTGFAAALLLKIAGASEELILQDYLKTNSSRKIANQKIIASKKNNLSSVQLNALKVALNVEQQYLIHAKKIMIEQYGSFEHYMLNGLKLETDYTNKFRNKYVID